MATLAGPRLGIAVLRIAISSLSFQIFFPLGIAGQDRINEEKQTADQGDPEAMRRRREAQEKHSREMAAKGQKKADEAEDKIRKVIGDPHAMTNDRRPSKKIKIRDGSKNGGLEESGRSGKGDFNDSTPSIGDGQSVGGSMRVAEPRITDGTGGGNPRPSDKSELSDRASKNSASPGSAPNSPALKACTAAAGKRDADAAANMGWSRELRAGYERCKDHPAYHKAFNKGTAASACLGETGLRDGYAGAYNDPPSPESVQRHDACYPTIAAYRAKFDEGWSRGMESACARENGASAGRRVGEKESPVTDHMMRCFKFSDEYKNGFDAGRDEAVARHHPKSPLASPPAERNDRVTVSDILKAALKTGDDIARAASQSDHSIAPGRRNGGGNGGGSRGTYSKQVGGTRPAPAGKAVTRNECMERGGHISASGTLCEYPQASDGEKKDDGGAGEDWCAKKGGWRGNGDICFDSQNNPMTPP